MSKISNIIDTLVSQLATTFPTHSELVNAYFPELNDDLTFEKSYGLKVGPQQNTNELLDCKASLIQEFEIVLTRKLYSGDIRSGDALILRKNAEKDLLEDGWLIKKAIIENNTLSNDLDIGYVRYNSDNGIEFIGTERTDILVLNISLEIKFYESLN